MPVRELNRILRQMKDVFRGKMKKIETIRLDNIFLSMQQKTIAVIGDLMVDRYVWGKVRRISPEAPVPIIEIDGESSNLGGAANVAANVGSLGAGVKLFGISGDDQDNSLLRDLLKRSGYTDDGILTLSGRQTSVKTRVIAQNQHVVRLDRETVSYLEAAESDMLLTKLEAQLDSIDGVILEDYNKGVLSPYLIHRVIELCKSRQIPVGVDPKFDNFWEYRGATLFKPNLRELESALGRKLSDDVQIEKAGREVQDRLECEYLLVTAGSRGMILFSTEGILHIPTQAHNVHDVSGAGDTVIATILTSLTGGASIEEAATLATHAAAVVIAEVGAVPVDADKLRRAVIGRD